MLPGPSLAKASPSTALDVWSTVSENKLSPRTDMVYNVEPYRAGVRKGDWKLVWTTLLPQRVELFDLSKIASSTDLAAQNPDKVRELQARPLSYRTGCPPLFMMELICLGLSHAPDFPGLGRAGD